MTTHHVAVDLGASSGRVLIGDITERRIATREVARFATGRLLLPSGLHWDIGFAFRSIVEGLRVAHREGRQISSIGIDTWGCDYGLLDGDGELVGLPYHHRDPRTANGVAIVHAAIAEAVLYQGNGIQHLPFNTIFQLADDRARGRLRRAASVLLIPDLIVYWLTGSRATEVTNASTTGLLDPFTRSWSSGLADVAGVTPSLLSDLVPAGTDAGEVRRELVAEEGLPASARVVRVGSHDTASAVVGVPAAGDEWAYIACGTWSLVGVELERPVVTDAGRLARFSNEGGVDGRTRYLHNVMGLWLLQESMRTWAASQLDVDLEQLLAAAARLPDGPVIDVDDPRLLPPGDMPSRLASLCEESGQQAPANRAALVRCILDSLAAAYARTIELAEQLSGRAIRTVHIVGGGCQNELLCQLTADACGRPIDAGPVEATALGNLLVQARATGALSGDLESLRAVVRASTAVRRYLPRHGRQLR